MTRYVYVGTYTEARDGGPGKEEGIYVFRMDPQTGRLEAISAAKTGPNPSYLALHPVHRFLYAVNETAQGQLCTLAVNPLTGGLTFLNSQPVHGSTTCYVSLDPTGKWAMVANYGDGTVTVLPVGEDGRLGQSTHTVQHKGTGADPGRQESAHAHSILCDPTGRFMLAADLGIDRVLVYTLDTKTGRLVPNDPPGASFSPGSGPRHMAFHPNGRFLFVANELNSTVTALAWDSEKGALQPVQSMTTLPAGWKGQTSVADIHVAPSGRYLYVSNRGHDSLAIFAVNEWTGTLFPDGHVSTGGAVPRNFAIDPFGAFLLAANQNSGTIITFRVEPVSGQLTNTRQITLVPSPVCIKMVDFS